MRGSASAVGLLLLAAQTSSLNQTPPPFNLPDETRSTTCPTQTSKARGPQDRPQQRMRGFAWTLGLLLLAVHTSSSEHASGSRPTAFLSPGCPTFHLPHHAVRVCSAPPRHPVCAQPRRAAPPLRMCVDGDWEHGEDICGDGGCIKAILTAGNGPRPAAGSRVSVEYTIRWPKKKRFLARPPPTTERLGNTPAVAALDTHSTLFSRR